MFDQVRYEMEVRPKNGGHAFERQSAFRLSICACVGSLLAWSVVVMLVAGFCRQYGR